MAGSWRLAGRLAAALVGKRRSLATVVPGSQHSVLDTSFRNRMRYLAPPHPSSIKSRPFPTFHIPSNEASKQLSKSLSIPNHFLILPTSQICHLSAQRERCPMIPHSALARPTKGSDLPVRTKTATASLNLPTLRWPRGFLSLVFR